jgi:hypothetical protein
VAPTLHVTNGATSEAALRAAGVQGPFVDGDDLLLDGPLPNGLRTEADVRARAAWLADAYGIDPAAYAGSVQRRRDLMASPGEAVLWTDDGCLHCALNLVFLLQLPGPAKCTIARVPGARLGEALPARLHDVERTEAGTLLREAARLAWEELADGHGLAAASHLRPWRWLADALAPWSLMPSLADTALREEGAASGLHHLMARLRERSDTRHLGLGDAYVRRRLGLVQAT